MPRKPAGNAVKDPKPEPAPDGVLLLKTIAENGDIVVDVQVLGDVRLTEVETLLKLGRKTWNARIGVEN